MASNSENSFSINPCFATFNKHYQSLTTALPAKAMYPTFVEKGLLKDPRLNDQFLSATTDIDRITLLLNSMRSGLQIGVVDVFQKFLEAMNEYFQLNENPVVKKLIEGIDNDLNFVSSSSSSGSYYSVSVYPTIPKLLRVPNEKKSFFTK